MSLTKEQKDGLIECLYDPIAVFIAGFVKSPKNFSVIEKLSKDSRDPDDRWAIWDLRYDLRWDTRNKIKFETRVMAIIDAYLEGKADGNKLPASEPVLDSDEVEASRQRTKEQALKSLSEFKWENLKSEDHHTAMIAWWRLDLLKGECAMHEDTQAALKAAAETAGVKF